MNAAPPTANVNRKPSPRATELRTIELLALAAVDGLGDEGVARVLKQARTNGKDLEDFYESDLVRLQSHYGLKRVAAECVKHQGSRLRAAAADLLERARGLGIVILAPADPGYPLELEASYDGQPPLLHARGNLALLASSTVAFVSSSGSSSQSLTGALGLASRLAEAGSTLVTGAQNPTYNIVALAGKRAAGNLIIVLHEGLLTAIGDAPEREPVPLARQAGSAFDPQRTLLLSPFRLDGRWQRGNGPRRDRLMVALAKTVVAMEIRPGGVVESLCRDAVARKRRVFVCQQWEAAGRSLANEAVLDLGAFPLVPDAVGSSCDLVLKPRLPTALSSVPETNDLERRRELGQFFTPPVVARFIWDMLEIIHGKRFASGTRVIDPACGDGVILHAAIERGRLPAGNLFGVDIDETLVPVWRQDTLLRAVLDALARALSRYACWRLGADTEEEEQSLAESDGAPGDLFAGLNLRSERRVVASDRVGPLRKWLSGQMDLLAVVSLPHRVFTGVGANAKTSILFAQRLLEPRPAGWDPATMLQDPLQSGKVVWLAAPQLDAPGWNLEWYLETVLGNASQHYIGLRQTQK